MAVATQTAEANMEAKKVIELDEITVRFAALCGNSQLSRAGQILPCD